MKLSLMEMAIVLIAGAVAYTSCASKKSSEDCSEDNAKKILVLYYSQTGATKSVAEEIQAKLGCDIEAVELENPYDGTYDETIQRCLREREDGTVPTIKPLKVNPEDYDVVFLGYPVWFGTYARPIMGLIETCKFAGVKVVPFCTFGSGGLESSSNDLKENLPEAEVLEGYGVRNARIEAAPAEIDRFLKESGYIDGEVEPLPDFSTQEPVDESETAIFEAACGDYQFPLGTPVTAGKRTVDGSTEYKFIVNSVNAAGEPTEGTIYVIVGSDEGSRPVFTKVVR